MNLTKRKKMILQSFMAIALLFIVMSMNTILAHATNVIVTFEAQDDGIIKYCENGEWKSDKYGFVSYDNNWFLVANGVLAVDVNGLAQDPNSLNDWYYLAGGMVQIQYTGLAEYDGAWFYLDKGILDTSFTGLYYYDGSRFLIGSGQLLSNYTGNYDVDFNRYFIIEGQVKNAIPQIRSQEEIKAFYNNTLAKNSSKPTFKVTPSLENNIPGELSTESLKDGLDTVNFVRFIAGMPYDIELNDEYKIGTEYL